MISARIADERALLVLELRVLLGVEERLDLVLARLAGECQDVQLRRGLERHRRETAQHALHLETALRVLGENPASLEPPSLEGLEREHAETLAGVPAGTAPEVGDLVVSGSGARIEHYEISSYEAALEKAELLGEEDVGELLHGNLDDERRMLDEGRAVSHRLASTLRRRRARA